MAETFDPYYKWLGIRPEDQPADHYRLLGLAQFEADPDVIEGAADRQMAHVHKHKTGPHAAISQKILNELAAAKLTLLNPAKKAAYDQVLRSQKRPAEERGKSVSARTLPMAKAVPASVPVGQAAEESLDFVHAKSSAESAARRTDERGGRKRPAANKKGAGWKGPGTYATVMLLVGVVGLTAMLWIRSKKWQIHLVEGDQSVAQAGAKPAEPPNKPVAPAAEETTTKPNDKEPPNKETTSSRPAKQAESPKPPSTAGPSNPPNAPQTVPPRPATGTSPSAPPRPATIVATAPSPTPAQVPAPSPAVNPPAPGAPNGSLKILRQDAEKGHTRWVAVAPEGKGVFWSGQSVIQEGDRKGQITMTNSLWNLSVPGQSYTLGPESPQRAAFTADGKYLVIVTFQAAAVVELPAMRVVRTTRLPQNNGMANVAIAPDGSCVAALQSHLHTVAFIDPHTGETVYQATELPGNGNQIALSPEGKYAFIGGTIFEQQKIAGTFNKAYDLKAKSELPIDLKRNNSYANSNALSSDGKFAVMAEGQQEIQIWSLPKNQLLSSLPQKDASQALLAFSPSGDRLVVAMGTGQLGLWNTTTGVYLGTHRWNEAKLRTSAVALSADGHWVVTGDIRGGVQLWTLGQHQGPTSPGGPAMPPAEQGPSAVPATSPSQAAAPAKSRPPNDTDREKVLKLIKDVYGAEYAKAKKPSDKVALSEKFQSQSTESKDLAEKYVLLDQAQELASDAGDPVPFLKALSTLGDAFLVDAPAIALEGANKMAEKQLAPKARADLAKGLLPLVDVALQEDHLDTAEKLVEVTLASARKAKDGALVKQVVERKSGIQELKKQDADLSDARDTLSKNADDPAANKTLGKAYCLLKDDWPRGLPLLAKCGDDALQELAKLEVTDPRSSGDQLKLADGWYSLGQSASGIEKAKYQSHAASWYRKALAELSGITRLKAQKRLDEIEGSSGK